MTRVWRVGPRWRPAVVIIAAILTLRGAPTLAQDVTEVALKAAFLYNFAKFTEWPSGVLPQGAPLVACVMGDAAVGDALERTVEGRLVDGHAISVSVLAPDALSPTCHLLYVSGMPTRRAMKIVQALEGAPVLTVSDLHEFAREGGIAEFYVEGGKMRFAINLGAARQSGLRLSSKLLALARLVEGPGHADDGSSVSLVSSVLPMFSAPDVRAGRESCSFEGRP